jgi:hypothetical protein
MRKKCTKCLRLLDLNLNNFYFHEAKKRFTSPCKDCQKQRNRNAYRSNETVRQRKQNRKQRIREESRCFVLDYLKAHPCMDCGESDFLVLQFDPREPSSKKYDVANMITNGWKLPLIITEIEKCDVRCANCHTRQTAKNRKYWKTLC